MNPRQSTPSASLTGRRPEANDLQTMKKPVYMDYAATTPVDPVVADEMMKYLTADGVFGNPASRSHGYGWQAEAAVETARRQVANLIGADPREIVWTSGATESDNLAIKGAVAGHQSPTLLPRRLSTRRCWTPVSGSKTTAAKSPGSSRHRMGKSSWLRSKPH